MESERQSAQVILLLGGAEAENLVTRALGEDGIRVDRVEEEEAFQRRAREADLVLLDRSCLGDPARVRTWLDHEVLNRAVPLLLLAERPVQPDEYRQWLDAGVWELVRLPVDPSILSLRLRNLLGSRHAASGHAALQVRPSGPYPWAGLLRATEETLSLARRHQRPISCMALAVEQQGEGAGRVAQRLMYRLGTAAREWVRDYDLVGLSEHDVLLLVLPDTDGPTAEQLAPRLRAALERSLRRAGTVASLRAGVEEPGPGHSASEFLLRAARRVG